MVFAARRVTKLFGRVPVLKELDLELEPGRCHAIFGRNGAGKSTLLRIAATLLKPSSGELFYDGRELSEQSSAVRAKIGFVSHQSFVYAELTVRENLEFYGQLYGHSRDVDELLEWSDLSLRQHSPARSLSRGMQQRLTIARALLHEPKLLLLDEPFTGLDALSAEKLETLLTDIKGQDTTVALATHDIERGVALADRILLMEAGRIVFDATGASGDELRRLLLEAPNL
jgi:heme exporter protein A